MATQKDLSSLLRGYSALIVDPSGSIKLSIAKALKDIGIDNNRLHMAGTFEKAVHIIQKSKPEVVISEYKLDTGLGSELRNIQADHLREGRTAIFGLVAGTSNEARVAEAQEEDVDFYILKPISQQQIETLIAEAADQRMNPPPYLQKISLVRQLIDDEKYDEAHAELEQAMQMTDRPSLALYYEGLAYFKQGQVEKAIAAYHEGLQNIPLHFKCLKGLYDIYSSQKQMAKAYKVWRDLLSHYPTSPDKLTHAIRMAIETKNGDDIPDLYELYRQMDERPNSLIKVMAAALMAAAKFKINAGEVDEASELFQFAMITSEYDPPTIESIVKTLIKYREPDAAVKFLKQFPIELKNSPLFAQLDFLITKMSASPEQWIEHGRSLIKSGKADAHVFRSVIFGLSEMGKHNAAESVIGEALKVYPEQRSDFYAILDNQQARL